MRMLSFARRNFKEMARDPLSIIFAVMLPLFLLFIFQQFDIPGEAYRIENFTPGTIIFGFSFLTMFTSTLVAKDRGTSLLTRLRVSPMRGADYVLGYTLAVLPMALIQNLLFFGAAIALGLDFSVGVILAVLSSLPTSLLFIGLGILIGSTVSEKAASGASSIIVQLVAFTSGMYFDSNMIGELFAVICRLLPFSGAVDILKSALSQRANGPASSIVTVAVYTVLIFAAAVAVLNKSMRKS